MYFPGPIAHSATCPIKQISRNQLTERKGIGRRKSGWDSGPKVTTSKQGIVFRAGWLLRILSKCVVVFVADDWLMAPWLFKLHGVPASTSTVRGVHTLTLNSCGRIRIMHHMWTCIQLELFFRNTVPVYRSAWGRMGPVCDLAQWWRSHRHHEARRDPQ